MANYTAKHGMYGTPEYTAWASMRQRCLNPRSTSFPRYGGRGIRVCPEWSDFAVFFRDMGPRPSPQHSLDRIDVNGDYAAENCRWATTREQALNRRSNKTYCYAGQTKTLVEWAESVPMHPGTLRARVEDRGWSIERALTTPVARRSPRLYRLPR